MLISVVLKKKFEFRKVNIDMRSAFNTIRSQTTIDLLSDTGCSSDELKLAQYLIARATLPIKVNGTCC